MHSFRNNIQLEGNLGKDAELKTTASGDVVNFIRFFGRDLETGQEIEMGGGVFPVEDGQDEKDAYADAMQTGQEWLQAQELGNED